MSTVVRALVVLAVAGAVAAPSGAAPRGFTDVAFVNLDGHGTVTSTPRGIHCPGRCRAIFKRYAHVTLHATPAPGWTFGHFEGWCKSRTRTCGFDLVSPHDCVGGACPIGAFGVRVRFVRST
ncbi:MAG: hypothetical protein ACJ76I_05225 [Gaiellaceae bacterium]